MATYWATLNTNRTKTNQNFNAGAFGLLFQRKKGKNKTYNLGSFSFEFKSCDSSPFTSDSSTLPLSSPSCPKFLSSISEPSYTNHYIVVSQVIPLFLIRLCSTDVQSAGLQAGMQNKFLQIHNILISRSTIHFTDFFSISSIHPFIHFIELRRG